MAEESWPFPRRRVLASIRPGGVAVFNQKEKTMEEAEKVLFFSVVSLTLGKSGNLWVLMHVIVVLNVV